VASAQRSQFRRDCERYWRLRGSPSRGIAASVARSACWRWGAANGDDRHRLIRPQRPRKEDGADGPTASRLGRRDLPGYSMILFIGYSTIPWAPAPRSFGTIDRTTDSSAMVITSTQSGSESAETVGFWRAGRRGLRSLGSYSCSGSVGLSITCPRSLELDGPTVSPKPSPDLFRQKLKLLPQPKAERGAIAIQCLDKGGIRLGALRATRFRAPIPLPGLRRNRSKARRILRPTSTLGGAPPVSC